MHQNPPNHSQSAAQHTFHIIAIHLGAHTVYTKVRCFKRTAHLIQAVQHRRGDDFH